MIILRLKGGIGNQMFQYSFGRTLALKYKTPLILDLSWYTRADRKYALNTLNIKYNLKITNRFVMRAIKMILKPKIFDDTNSVKDIAENAKKIIVVDGYWEKSKYFQDEKINEILKKELSPKKTSDKFSRYVQEIDINNSIAVHVRRGDLLRDTDTWYVLSEKYFLNGIQTIVEKAQIKSPKIVIFSEDIEWCKEMLAGTIQRSDVTVFNDAEISDFEQMLLMSKYKYLVISNSTYSWWSAFINKNYGKIIVAPRRWRKDKIQSERVFNGIIMQNWIIKDDEPNI
ncbi:MAG: alpha-1,2-fucosyltransferase [bacterium]